MIGENDNNAEDILNKDFQKIKKRVNQFKFILYEGKNIINTRIIDADKFNPLTRYSVDIRGIIPSINQRLQRTLSSRRLSYIDTYGEMEYDFIRHYKDVRDATKSPSENKLEKPLHKTQTINDREIRGVECKFGLYINNNPIVERDFYVDGYNPATRFSVELVDVVKDICSNIEETVKIVDVKNMWDDYYLIKAYRINSQQIRELNSSRRREMIANMDDLNYIKKTKGQFRNKRY